MVMSPVIVKLGNLSRLSSFWNCCFASKIIEMKANEEMETEGIIVVVEEEEYRENVVYQAVKASESKAIKIMGLSAHLEEGKQGPENMNWISAYRTRKLGYFWDLE